MYTCMCINSHVCMYTCMGTNSHVGMYACMCVVVVHSTCGHVVTHIACTVSQLLWNYDKCETRSGLLHVKQKE